MKRSLPSQKLGKLPCCSHRLWWETLKTIMNLQMFGKLQMPPLLAPVDWVFPCARCLPRTITLKVSGTTTPRRHFFIYLHFTGKDMGSERSDLLKFTQWQQIRIKGGPFFCHPFVACGIPVPCPGMESMPSAVMCRSNPNHWSDREFSIYIFFLIKV